MACMFSNYKCTVLCYYLKLQLTSRSLKPRPSYRLGQVSSFGGNARACGSLLTMHKQTKQELRHVRLKTKIASWKSSPSYFVLTALGNGAKGNPRCLYITSDHASYLFNCGEATQRLGAEHKLKFSKLEHVFFTYKSWENIGGLTGLSLTIQSIGVPGITLHGPTDIKEMYRITKNFIFLENLEIVQKDPDEGTFSDRCMKIDYVLLQSRNGASNKHQCCQMTVVTSDKVKLYTGRPASPQIASKRRRIANESEDFAVAYICKLHNKEGTLLLENCVAQNVPPGPLLGQLKNGNDVTLPDGRVVRACDVLSPEKPGPVFIVLECPGEDFIDSLMDAKAFQVYQQTTVDDENCPSVVVHFSPPQVVTHPKYQEWMNRFPKTTFHMLLNSDCSNLSSTGVYEIQHKLHLLHPQIFPLLSQPQESSSFENNSNTVYADTLLKFSLRPDSLLDRKAVVKLEEEVYIQEAKENTIFMEALNELKLKISTTDPKKDSQSVLLTVNSLFGTPLGKDTMGEIIFLGTGSSIPAKVRNVSSILWNVSPGKSLLLDCGEGTYSQLVRFYGFQKAQDILLQLNTIFLSHRHADHHMGLFEVLKKREDVCVERNQPYIPVDILAPIQFYAWFQQYHTIIEPINHLFRLIPLQLLLYNDSTVPNDIYLSLLKNMNMKQVNSVYVKHCKNAFGIVLTTVGNWKLVYSGDTMPCPELVDAGQNCSLLIHEATMEDDLEDEAKLKAHSTTSQAIEVGKQMNAKFTLLTHFSQRYAKVPIFTNDFNNTVGCAFDNMKITEDDFATLPLLIPCLKHLFHEHYEEMQERTSKKLHRRQLAQQQLASS